MTQNMIQYLENIYSVNGNEGIVIIAHSMGGLVALSAAQQKPDLVKGIVFCGTPFGFGGVPLILWGIQRGNFILVNQRCSAFSCFFSRIAFWIA